MINKLITHEDPYWLHKLPGLYCLGNFLYQFTNYFFYNKYYLNVNTLLPHFFIHLSSFIFKVISKRTFQSRSNMFIWEELRLHSMVFAYRGCFIILFPDYSKEIVLLTLLFADLITFSVGDKNISTVRGNHEKISNSPIKKMYSSFFSISQMGATLICSGCFQPQINTILVFSTLPAIQTSAFGLTLLRKNIIDKSTWSIIYSVELLMVYIIWYIEYNDLNVLYISIILYLLRTLNISKYSIWLTIFFIDFMDRSEVFNNFIKIH